MNSCLCGIVGPNVFRVRASSDDRLLPQLQFLLLFSTQNVFVNSWSAEHYAVCSRGPWGHMLVKLPAWIGSEYQLISNINIELDMLEDIVDIPYAFHRPHGIFERNACKFTVRHQLTLSSTTAGIPGLGIRTKTIFLHTWSWKRTRMLRQR